MNKEVKIAYWIKSSGKDWKAANHLFEKGDYAYSLFFGHLAIEKLLKGIFVEKLNEVPPYTHRLVFLAEKSRTRNVFREARTARGHHRFPSRSEVS